MVAATGVVPLYYQWYQGQSGDTSVPIAGATSRSYTTPASEVDKTYWVVVSNALGVAESRTARVRIAFEVWSLDDLKKIGSAIDGWTMNAAYVLMTNINASATAGWNDADTDESVLEGFQPIGKDAFWFYDDVLGEYVYVEPQPFEGLFDGNGNYIGGLTINRDDTVGLFGLVGEGASVNKLGLVNCRITGEWSVGGLAGWSSGYIAGCFTMGQVTGEGRVGGLVGANDEFSVLEGSYSGASVEGDSEIGGLAGCNYGTIRVCHATGAVRGDPDEYAGGLVGYAGDSWSIQGSTVMSYWDMDYTGQTNSAGGIGKTSLQMSQQETFEGWDFAGFWGIQAEVGAPYLKRFSAGRTEHLTTPGTVFPENLAFIGQLRPTFTATVATASSVYGNAHWQVTEDPSFSSVHEWFGLAPDVDTLRAPFMSRVAVSHALDYGLGYYWRVRVQSWYGMWSDWSSPALFLVSKPVQQTEGGKDSLGVWIDGMFEELWMPKYLFLADEQFDAAITTDPEDYEARIYRALTTLAKLSENEEFHRLMTDFGFEYSISNRLFSGTFAGRDAPGVNDAVDCVAAQTLPAIISALADLSVIPLTWADSVLVSPDKFPVDEPVYVDNGDVLALRSACGMARAALLTAQAYDLNIDYAKTNIYVPRPEVPLLTVTLDGYGTEWTNTPAVLFGSRAQLEEVKVARSDTQFFVLARTAPNSEATDLWLELASEDYSDWVYFSQIAEGIYQADDWSGMATLIRQGDFFEIEIDLPAGSITRDFYVKYIAIQWGLQPPPNAQMLAVTVDGDVSEWAGVPVSAYGNREYIDHVKIARSSTEVFVMISLKEGVESGLINYFDFGVNTSSGDGFSHDSGSARYAAVNNVIEISATLPEQDLGDDLTLSWVNVQGISPEGFGYVDQTYHPLQDWEETVFENKRQPFNRFLQDHPDALRRIRNPDNLTPAASALREALQMALLSDAAITSRTDTVMHFIEYDTILSNEQAEVRQRLQEAKASMKGPQRVTYMDYSENIYLGAFFAAQQVTRSLLPRLTDDDEVVYGTFRDPTFTGILPDATETRLHDELLGRIPLVWEDAFMLDGQHFSTGGYAFWRVEEEAGIETKVTRSGVITNSCLTWAETTFTGPGTLDFSWTVSSEPTRNILSVYVDGVRQPGSLSGEPGWGPRQLVLGEGEHRVRWMYVRNRSGGDGADSAAVTGLSWVPAVAQTTTTPVPVPFAWLDLFAGLVQNGDYEAAAWGDQDSDNKKTWEEYVTGTQPLNPASVFIATIQLEGASPFIGWIPDLTPQRVYTVEGKERLVDIEWTPTNNASRFFRVKVSLP